MITVDRNTKSEKYLLYEYRVNGFPSTMNHRTQALGENLYADSEDSLTIYGYAIAMYFF